MRDIGYACTDCYIAAHDPSYEQDHVDPNDVAWTDWTCSTGVLGVDGDCVESLDTYDVCTGCDGSGTGTGIHAGGQCELGGHRMVGYWNYHEYLI